MMLHSVKYSLVIHSQVINSFTYICSREKMSNDELAERIKNNYRNISKVPVTSVQINSVRIYEDKING